MKMKTLSGITSKTAGAVSVAAALSMNVMQFVHLVAATHLDAAQYPPTAVEDHGQPGRTVSVTDSVGNVTTTTIPADRVCPLNTPVGTADCDFALGCPADSVRQILREGRRFEVGVYA